MSNDLAQKKTRLSDKIPSPKVHFKAKTKKITKIIMYILVLACWIGFPVTALAGNLEMSTAILQAAVLSGIIVLLSAFQSRR